MTDKIGVLFLQAQEGFGADGAVHADIMRHLDRDRFDVHIACTAGTDGREPPSLAILRQIPNARLRVTQFAPSLGERSPSAILRALRGATRSSADFAALARYVVREKIRIVHSAERPRDAVYNVALSKITRAQSVVHVHVKWSDEYSAPAKWGVRHAAAAFSISRYVTDTLRAMGKPDSAIFTVLNGIDTAKWDPSLDGSAVRREFGIPNDASVLVSVSRLFSWKGQRELLQAFALVQKEFPNSRLLIVGADAREVEGTSFSAELEALTRRLGLENQVIFTGPRTDVARILAACDLFTMPSFEEPFGLVFLEAMAMQKPVLALNNGGTPEVVEHGVTGLLATPYDIPAYAENILTLLRDPELRERMGRAGRARVLDRFDARRMARDAGAAYERIVATR